MRIAVVDVAAQVGGALSVLYDFVDRLIECEGKSENEWYIITSVVETKESEHVHNLKFPEVKHSWFHRLWWEYTTFKRLVKELHIDIIFSLQNNGLPVKHVKQIVYMHNVLLVQNKVRFSWLEPTGRALAVYSYFLAPYVRYSWRYADKIIVQGNSVKEQVGKFFSKEKVFVCMPDMKWEKGNEATEEIEGFIYPTTAMPYKNIELIVRAVKKLENEGKKIEVFITIGGDENYYAERIKRESSETKGIHLIGYQERQYILDSYRNLGLLIVSKLESFPIPILEAMNSQTVIVALDLPYVKNHPSVTDYNRLYIAQENADDLATVLYKAKQDKKKGNYVCSVEENGIDKIIELLKGTNDGT